LKNDRLGTAPAVVGKVDGKEFVNPPDDLRSILARELTRLELLPDLSAASAGFVKQLPQPQLDITFDENGKGFVHPFKGESFDRQSIVDWKLYRAALNSRSTAPGTRLRAVDVTLKGGDTYPSLSLRITGDHEAAEFKLHAGIPQLWDVVEKPIGSDWVRLTHAVKTVPPLIFQAPYSFKITASCDSGFSISKLVTLDVHRTNNNELTFRLDDV
jgi:hypothetical protein